MANLEYEEKFYEQGLFLVAGCDEAGRGPLAGPLCCAAVILPKGYCNPLINDSKKLTEKKREALYDVIINDALAYNIQIIDEETIDEINIYQASKLGMERALKALNIKPEAVLSDAMKLDIEQPYIPLVKGDAKSQNIAAASILAKVHRDRLMYELDKKYPHYDFAHNKGYGTKKHLEAIKQYGITKYHRLSYKPVADNKDRICS
jgi:ribonuclease HII